MDERTGSLARWIRSGSAVAALIMGTTHLAHAGAGVGQSTNGSGDAIQVPTFYANSPAGIWTDWAGNTHDSGTALRKFVDPLPGLCGPAGTPIPPVTQLRCIPVANPDTTTFPGSDYYEIGIVEYAAPMHSDLPKATTLRGYVQLNDPSNPVTPATAATNARYLGPMIVAVRGRPVRVKYTNLLPTGHFNPLTGRGGDLFLPVDKTLQGAGTGAQGGTETFTENRGVFHLHGGDTPWISDGTPHQWITPAGETTSYPNGASFATVPDMPIPGQGSGTLYYPNGQGARLLFYHDHTAGITRLNVYAGEAAPYLLTEPAAESLLPIPGVDPIDQIPLVIQDKTFVPKDIAQQDAKWNQAAWGAYGDLWAPHVYEVNQDPSSADGTNPVGRWDYGPFFWPIFPAPDALPTGDYGDASTTPEAFGDTPVVNGVAYPTVTLDPKAYRFRVLNATNDRFLNLGLYTATRSVTGCSLVSGGSSYPSGTIPVRFAGSALDPTIPNAQAATGTATVIGGVITAITLTSFGSGYIDSNAVIQDALGNTSATASCELSGLTEIAAVPFDSSGTFPSTGGLLGTGWGFADNRVGGVPSPATAGPSILQIGSEGGFLPAPVAIPSTPINFEYNKKSVTVLNVLEHGLYLGSAERADVVIDFSAFAGKTLILYNDAPAPLPAGDPRLEYYTGNEDMTAVGGAAATLPGFGPNMRTVMQIVVNPGPIAPYDPAPLAAALAQAYAVSQPRPVVAQQAYGPPFGATFPNQFAHIYTGSAAQPQVTWLDGNGVPRNYSVSGVVTIPDPNNPQGTITVPADGLILNKAIQELFDSRGRMNATLGVELPFTSSLTQTTIPLGYIDPTTETINDGETQIWKITHNGVDTHPVHFHLLNVQLINRVGWDGTIKPPDANELGWKETLKMNPLEDVLVAVRAKAPRMPFSIPNSIRRLDPTQPLGTTNGFTQVDPTTGNPAVVTNVVADFGWEYVWHCHILGHEENDFMRPFVLRNARGYNTADLTAPQVTATVSPIPVAGWNRTNPTVTLTATDNPAPNGSGVDFIAFSAAGAQTIPLTTVKTPTNTTYVFATPVVPALTAEGITTVAFSATDNAATPNTAAPASIPIRIDRTAPTITAATSPSSVTRGGGNATVTVSGTVTDQAGLSGVVPTSGSFTLTDSKSATVVNGTFTISATGVYSFTRSISRQNSGPTTAANARIYTFTLTARDVAGNTGTAVATFTVQ